MTVFQKIRQKFQDDAAAIAQHILEGRCKDIAEYREKVARRKALIDALETVKAEFGRAEMLNDEDED